MGCHPIEVSSHHRGVPSKSLFIALFPPAHVTCLLFKAYPSSRSPLGGSSLNLPSSPKTIQLSELKTLMSVLLGLPALCFCVRRFMFVPLGRRQIWEGLFLCVAPGYFLFSCLIIGKWKKRDCRIGLITRETVRCGYDIHSGSFLSEFHL